MIGQKKSSETGHGNDGISSLGPRAAFGALLRKIRIEHGFASPENLAKAIREKCGHRRDVSSILKRERGELNIDEHYLADFLEVVNAPKSQKRHLKEYVRFMEAHESNLRGGNKSQDKLESLDRLANGVLKEAGRVKIFSPTILPLVFQTKDYIREVFRTYRPHGDELTIDEKVKMAEYLRKTQECDTSAIFSEAALYCNYGGADIMVDQLEKILEISMLKNVHCRIIPKGRYPNLPDSTAFTIIDDFLVVAESMLGNFYIAGAEETSRFSEHFDTLWMVGRSGNERSDIINDAINHMKKMQDHAPQINELSHRAP